MIDFIPLQNYYDVFIYFCFFLVLLNVLHAYTLTINNPKNLLFIKFSGYLLLILIILYVGLRPINGKVFGDMTTYHNYFLAYSYGSEVTVKQDILFHFYMKFLSNFVNGHGFFLISMILYTMPMYLISKRYFQNKWFYAFLMFVVSFSFFTYATNGIRNGLATSMFLWGLCFKNKKLIMSLFFILAASFHKTLLLPILAFVLTFFYNNPKTYLKAWILAIPLSFFLGSFFIGIFTSLGFGDDRLTAYLTGDFQTDTRFRWDFLFYSGFPVFAGWFYIFKKKFNDIFYTQLLNTYLVCNGFWILVIRANFSNRFAYLSWFLMAIVIIYPLLKVHFFKQHQVVIAKVVMAYFMFTFLMYFVYYAS